ncbi:alkaline phosphatase [Rikenella microfusus]|uniref:alkaline phosphatase n=1 Tax=Rikenella microfusus TaxID=28139 RepID=UPI001DF57122|nr:alkaline phosphatase [Rikenella microfusus]HJE88092.1 alkaline phosphatase [Rikenella microfusus]
MKKTLFLLLFLAGLVCRAGERPKYIFYFIGDGMGHNALSLTEACLASEQGDDVGFGALHFTRFPVVGFATTWCANRRMTDSAAAGTALASGQKTSVGTIGMNAERTEPVQSVAVAAKEQGMRTGVATSVSIDHATPASFYAHQPTRNMYYEIAMDAPQTGLDLYAGSGFLKPEPKRHVSLYDALDKAGYRITRGDNEIAGRRAVLMQEEGADPANLPLAIDRRPGDLTLPAVTRRSIDFLMKDGGARKGFFLMVEGGQIDWAAHSNDAAALVQEVRDFDSAICVALGFWREHPDETLIVITADHETGGLSLGRDNLGYDTYFGLLAAQKCSKGVLKAAIEAAPDWETVKKLLGEKMGFGTLIAVTPEEWTELEETHVKNAGKTADLAVDILARHAGAGWTTGSHTATYVPVFAIGASSEMFGGRLDNTQIADGLRKLIGAE